jgi:hypothetical protein
MWVPATIVGLRGLLGVDLYTSVSVSWIAANAVFGVAVIPLSIWAARALDQRLPASHRMRKLINAIAGNSLAAAVNTLETVHRFENDL